MNLEKLFGSKTKVDILKYLIFRRQGISMRALESEIGWTFPAIKKQIDSLDEAGVLDIQKESGGFAISIKPVYYDLFKQIFSVALKSKLIQLFEVYKVMINKYFLGKCFGVQIDIDIMIVHVHMEKPQIDELKSSVSEIFREFFIENVSMVFMSYEDWEKRYRLTDKFVMDVVRCFPNSQ